MKKTILYTLAAIFTAAIAAIIAVGCNNGDGGDSAGLNGFIDDIVGREPGDVGGGDTTPTTYTLAVTADPQTGGSVDVDPNQERYEPGTTVTLTATGMNGYDFVGWSGSASGSENPLTLVMNGNKSLKANFTQNTPVDTGSFVDNRGGVYKRYKTVKIGSQQWMAENLNYDTADGTGSWCFDNNPANCANYGRLYNWATAMGIDMSYNYTIFSAGATHRGICPSGWHLPTDEEWGTLVSFVGDNAGKKLKSQSGWNDYNGQSSNGTDNYGFNALPGGHRYPDDTYLGTGNNTLWWTASSGNADNAYSRHLYQESSDVHIDSYPKSLDFSVRCVADD